MNESTFAELAAGYALSALSPSDRAAFETALADHPEWEKHVRTEADTVMLLSDSVAPVAPPPNIREALMARIATTPQTTADADVAGVEEDFAAAGPAPVVPPAKATGGLRRRWFTLAASIVVLLALGFGAVTIGRQLTRPAAVVALEQIENAADAQSATIALADGGEATAHWSSQRGEVVLISEGLPALPGDKTYELWFVREEGAIAAGTFAANDGAATALLDGTYEPGDVIAVTVEPSGGSPMGIPSGAPIFAIETA